MELVAAIVAPAMSIRFAFLKHSSSGRCRYLPSDAREKDFDGKQPMDTYEHHRISLPVLELDNNGER